MLTERQRRLYTFRCELYRPSVIAPHASGSRATDRAADEGWAAPPAYKNVPCYYASAEEATQPTGAGLQSEANLFTFYNFYFDAAQEIGNGWAIRFTVPGHPDDGEWFLCAGQAQDDRIRRLTQREPEYGLFHARPEPAPDWPLRLIGP